MLRLQREENDRDYYHRRANWQEDSEEDSESDPGFETLGEAIQALTAGEKRRPWVRHEKRWQAFEAGPPDSLTPADVPWPPSPEAMLAHYTRERAGDEPVKASHLKLAFKQVSLRWHPDKFVGKFGAKMAEAHREAVLDRVKGVAQAVNSSYEDLAKLDI